MPGAFINFFKDQDQLGSSISLNYRGSSGFGTILGGCLSLALSIFVAGFMGLQCFAWAFQSSYSQSFEKTYLQRRSSETYEISAQQFLPSAAIITDPGDGTQSVTINDPRYFSMKWS